MWLRPNQVFDEEAGRSRSLAMFADDRCEAPAADDVIRLRLVEMGLRRPRQWGVCWLASILWRKRKLDRFWGERLPKSRKGARWDNVLKVLVSYRLIAPGGDVPNHRFRLFSGAVNRIALDCAANFGPGS